VVDLAFFCALEVIRAVIASSVPAHLLGQHELKNGYRQEAMSTATMLFCIKATSGLGILFGSLIRNIGPVKPSTSGAGFRKAFIHPMPFVWLIPYANTSARARMLRAHC
jgi:Na+/melibiose symporter-like transporter